MSNCSPRRRESPQIPKRVGAGVALVALGLAGSACGDADLNEITELPELVFDYEIGPDTLDFGAQAIGATGRELTFDVTNTGETELVIVALDPAPRSELVFFVDRPVVQPGATQPVSVRWEPTRPGLLFETVKVLVGESHDHVEESEIAFRGNARGAAMSLSTTAYDFGDTPLGCTGTLNLTITNSGNEDLVVDSVLREGDDDFTLRFEEPPPWVVPPFGSAQFSARYAPDDVDGNLATAVVRSNVGVRRATLTGLGVADTEERIEAVVAERKASTIIVHVNAVAVYGTAWGKDYAERLDKALPTFFEALQDTGVDYRVAFIWNATGIIDGGDFIDNTVSPATARRMALNQIANGKNTNFDQSIDILLNAVRVNESWLFEDDYWSESKLSLIAINNDDDWSRTLPAAAVAEARSYKELESDAVFHSIAVSTGGTCGVPHGLYRDAVLLSDGISLDFCELDWHDHMRKLVANSVVGGRQNGSYFVPLSGTPLVPSIRVELDREILPGNWVYDPSTNSVVFDLAYAFDGRDLVVSYRGSNACGS